mmetsp:Transcript_119222/g.380044  ORF Transcript_119222/g.380044 Transcript_119222/m.380044 type:complete len:890 (+) Transcript_119222:35-2704(+)
MRAIQRRAAAAATSSVRQQSSLLAAWVPGHRNGVGFAFAAVRRCSSDSLIDCSKVQARLDAYGGVGAFAAQPIKRGEVVERGVVRRLPVDGNDCAYVFTWSPDRSVWASGSGCSVFYNASLAGTPNTEMARYFDEDKFEIIASRDIAENEELTHLYKSLEWRECFKELKAIRDRMPASAEVAKPVELVSGSPIVVDCSKVYAKKDAFGGVGAYAKVPIKKGELVERGIVRRLPVDGNVCPFVFTWSEDGTVWASGSGCSVFYNASLDGSENTEMKRFFDEDRFEVYAVRDIAKDEEVTHLYKSIEWRECFKDLKELRRRSIQIDGADIASSDADSARGSFAEYWNADHSAPTLENMMLDSDAGTMDRLERPEILSALPSLAGKRVLELGAGIGRFSGILAQKAGEVVAVDFVDSSCSENRRLNADCTNLQVMHADVTMLELKPNSFDLVFSNWLLMYLTDDEVRDFAKKVLTWLKPGGHLFFRESCFHASGNAARRFNPTQYRDPNSYSQMFSESVSGDGSRFQLLATNCVESYAKMKGNVHQMWFRWEKIGPMASNRRMRTLQTGQYTPAHCLRYEKIYGRSYIYTGGDEVSRQILEHASPALAPGSRCLDIGSGLGGTALYFATQRPDIFVHGVNHSGELYSLVAGRHVKQSREVRERLTFELAPEAGIPENELRYPPNSFDVIIIRESMMYLDYQDKPVLLQKASRLLRPGGRLIVVDYGFGKPDKEVNSLFREHLQEWGYFLMEPAEQRKLLQRYFEVEDTDATEHFVRFMDEGLANIEEHFGESALVRQNAGKDAEQLELLRSPLIGQMQAALPRLSVDAVDDAVEAAMAKLNMHFDAERADAEVCKADYEWARRTWMLERRAAAEGDLRWTFFVAVKKGVAES